MLTINRIDEIIDLKIRETKIGTGKNLTIDANNSLFQHSTYNVYFLF